MQHFVFCLLDIVLSNELQWLPRGSELTLSTEKPDVDPTSRPRTYTSFNCSQDSLPEFSNNPIGPKHDDIIIAKLGPGQVGIEFFRPLG